MSGVPQPSQKGWDMSSQLAHFTTALQVFTKANS